MRKKNVFRVHFTWEEKKYILKANSLDMTHPYFIAIKDLLLPEESSVLINPADDDVRKKFKDVRQLILPFQSVSLIEEFREDPDQISSDKKKTSGEKKAKGEVVVEGKFK